MDEEAGQREICVAIVSPTVTQLSAASSVAVTFINGGSANGILLTIVLRSIYTMYMPLSISHFLYTLFFYSLTAPADYQQVANPSDVLQFPALSPVTNSPATSTSRCFTVPIIDDIMVEGPETFFMGLTGALGLIAIDQTSPQARTTVTIDDDDECKSTYIMLAILYCRQASNSTYCR